MVRHIVLRKPKGNALGSGKAKSAGLIKEKLEALAGYQIHPAPEAVKSFVREVRTERRVVDCEV